jgi:prepilin-type processing-associated H-X9-DG protein
MDLPASHHKGGANIAYADGHVAARIWESPTTRPPSRPEAAALPFHISEADDADYEWLMDRTSIGVKKKY